MISILVPTKNRPSNVTRLVNSIQETSGNISNVEIVYYLDDADESSLDAVRYSAERVPSVAIQGNIHFSQMYKELYNYASGDIYMFAADDIVFKTPKWDSMVLEEFQRYEDKILFLYGDDGFQNGRIGTHGFLHRHWIELVGYIIHPHLTTAFADDHITDIAIKVGRRSYRPDILIEHLHPAVGKAQLDSVYADRINVALDPTNAQQIYHSLEPERVLIAQKLKAFMDIFTQK